MIRILAGAYKGRSLLSPPPGSQTRPFTGAARKSLLDTLGARLDGATVLDLYCGTGTMGLEALSRGAAWCGFAERDRAVLQRLRRNIEIVGAQGRCLVWAGDVAKDLPTWLADLDGPVDIAFVDPPYAQVRRWGWPEAAKRIFAPLGERLSAGGLVVLRAPTDAPMPERIGPLAVERRRQYGNMLVTLLRYDSREEGT